MEDQLCAMVGTTIVAGATSVIAMFSLIANFVKADSLFGKIIHWLALNISVNKK